MKHYLISGTALIVKIIVRAKQQLCGKFLHRPLLQKKLWATFIKKQTEAMNINLQQVSHLLHPSPTIFTFKKVATLLLTINSIISDIPNGEHEELKSCCRLNPHCS